MAQGVAENGKDKAGQAERAAQGISAQWRAWRDALGRKGNETEFQSQAPHMSHVLKLRSDSEPMVCVSETLHLQSKLDIDSF